MSNGHYRPLDIRLPHEKLAAGNSDFLCLPADFFQSAMHTAVQTPINSVTQMVNREALPQVQIIDAPQKMPELSPRWQAQQMGAALGAAADIAAIEYLSAGAIPAPLMGACYDGLLRPVENTDQQLEERLKNAAIGGAGYGTFRLCDRALAGTGAFAQSMEKSAHTLWDKLATNNTIRTTLRGTISGIPSGLVTSTLSGAGSARDLAIGAYTSAISGLGLGAIHATVERQARQKQQNLELSRLEAEVITDHLTGLNNRRGIDKAMVKEFARSIRSHKPLSVIYGDLDGFKAINDHFGHAKGDQVLSVVSAVIKEQVRKYDHAGRSGGDEFTIILPDTDAVTAQALAQRLEESLRLKYWDGTKEHSVGISLGVVTRGRTEKSLEAFQQRADAEMYRVKEGRKKGSKDARKEAI